MDAILQSSQTRGNCALGVACPDRATCRGVSDNVGHEHPPRWLCRAGATTALCPNYGHSSRVCLAIYEPGLRAAPGTLRLDCPALNGGGSWAEGDVITGFGRYGVLQYSLYADVDPLVVRLP